MLWIPSLILGVVLRGRTGTSRRPLRSRIDLNRSRLFRILRIRSRHLILCGIEPASAVAVPGPGDGFAFRRATTDDLSQLITDYEDKLNSRADMRRRMARGERLYLQVQTSPHERLAWVGWIREGRIRHLALDQELDLPPGSADIFAIHTRPEFRNRGLARRGYGLLLEELRSAGCRQAFVQVDCDNTPSIRSIEAAGFRPYRRVRYLRFLGLRCYVIRDVDAPRVALRLRLSGAPRTGLNRLLFPAE